MKLIADCHLHSDLSYDADNSIDEMCAAAVARGLQIVCFNNHYEEWPGEHTVQQLFTDLDRYDEEIARARDRYGDRLTILQGIECGQPHERPDLFENVLHREYDQITASIHAVDMQMQLHWMWWDRELTRNESRDYFYERYFESMERLVEFGGFDQLSHIDQIKRFWGDDESHGEQLRRILKKLVEKGIVTEINSAGYRQGGGCFYPAPSILADYRAAGGQRLTVGSDAHNTEDIAAQFDAVADYLAQESFTIGYFEQRTFKEIRL